jgi:hypothetical protein
VTGRTEIRRPRRSKPRYGSLTAIWHRRRFADCGFLNPTMQPRYDSHATNPERFSLRVDNDLGAAARHP